MMHGKAVWKSLTGALPLDPTSGVYSMPFEPLAVRGQHADARWVMAYGHKTQSVMKNGGQEKC